MSIAAKCICGESIYFCVGTGKCPYVYNAGIEPLTSAWDMFKESSERVKKKIREEMINNLKYTTVILPK